MIPDELWVNRRGGKFYERYPKKLKVGLLLALFSKIYEH